MEIEEFVASNDQNPIIKRKRTKRQRSSSPFGVSTMSCSSSSDCGGSGGGGGCSRGGRGEKGVAEDCGSPSSPTTSGGGEIYESTEEEEDMANCLIMLAQSEGPRQREANEKIENMSDGITTIRNRAGFLVYECKTCNRSFPSFQALGGHRASHKKTKAASHEEKKPQILKEDFEDEHLQFNANTPPSPPLPSLSLQASNNKVTGVINKANKIHECSICGAEFTSGQALGGHMRRHRAAAASASATASTNQVGLITTDTTTSTTTESSQNDNHHEIKPRNNILALDLNLPAPEDDHRGDSKFQFPSTQPPPPQLVFSAGPTLVDCHY